MERTVAFRRKLTVSLLLAVVASTFPIIVAPPRADAALCLAQSDVPFLISQNTRVRYRGYGECTSPVKGIRVHIEAYVDGLFTNSNDGYISQNTCGGPNNQPNISRCPLLGYYAISTARLSGTHYYCTKIIIDVVYGGQAFWSLHDDDEQACRFL